MSIQTNSDGLQRILQAVNSLPEGTQLPTLSNPGTASDLASGKQLIGQNGNIITGTHQCQAGVTVQVKTGTVTGVSGTNKTVNCGFKPDAVFFTGTVPQDNSAIHAGVAFTEKNVTSMAILFSGPSTSYLFSQILVKQTSTGFTVAGGRYSVSGTMEYESNRSLDYIAIKYTE